MDDTLILESQTLTPDKLVIRNKIKNFLIVEDDPFWQKKIVLDIQNEFENAQCLTVSSAEAALDVLRQKRYFDAIVADHWLQGEFSGMDVWKNLSDLHKDTAFVLVSGDSLSSLDSQSIQAADIQFMQKPFNSYDLSQVINSARPMLIDLRPKMRTSDIVDWMLVGAAGLFMCLVFITGLLAVGSTHSARQSMVEMRTKLNPASEATSTLSRFEVESVVTPKLKAQLGRIVQESQEAYLYQMERKSN